MVEVLFDMFKIVLVELHSGDLKNLSDFGTSQNKCVHHDICGSICLAALACGLACILTRGLIAHLGSLPSIRL